MLVARQRLFALWAVCAALPACGFDVSATPRVRVDAANAAQFTNAVWRAAAWRNERVNAQFVVWTREGAEQLRVKVGDLVAMDGGKIPAAACRARLTMVTGGEVGFGRLIEREALQENGRAISFLAESLSERVYQSGLSEMIATSRALVMSIIHPEAKYTASHALERNKCLYALSRAAFVLACEKGKGVAWDGAVSALRNGYAERVYVWENPALPGNMELIARGANDSMQHLDFMIGTRGMNIDGVQADGTVVPVFRNGNWAEGC